MKISSLIIILSLLSTLLTGCHEEVQLETSLDTSQDKIGEMIHTFHQQIHPNSRSNISCFRIQDISTETYKLSDNIKTRNSTQSESYDIHTVSIDFDGTPGYAILSDTPGIEKIFYYTEEGCIGDTARNFILKDMIETYPKIAEDIISGNILDTRSDIQNYPNIQPLVRFHWLQGKPFNSYSTYCECSQCSQDYFGNHRPIGCVAIALGQAIATVEKFTGTFYGNRDIDFKNFPIRSVTSDQYLPIAHFLQEIALNCQTKFGCGKSTTNLEAAYNYLKDLGYNPLLSSGGLIELKFIDNLIKGFPHIISGKNGEKGHAWILDGYTNNTYGKLYHINWGQGELSSDGWSIGYYFGSLPNTENGGTVDLEYKSNFKQLYLRNEMTPYPL